MRYVTQAVTVSCVLFFFGTASLAKMTSPLNPEQAKAAFELESGLAVSRVTNEPLVASPAAMTWDEKGRMYVAENRGYPVGGPGGKAIGVIALLEDTNADGLPDKRSEFATGLTFPNGVMPWRGGVIVTCAPDVLYLKDTDGDGKADVREVFLTGFSILQTTQLRVNAPTLGPDGWVYLAGGLVAGKVHSTKNPSKVLDTQKSDVRFKPDTGEIELVDGKGQYGLTFDDAGHRFVCFNRVQVQHAPLPSRYLARNKAVTSPGVLQNCPDLVKNLMLGLSNDAGAKIFPISSNLTTADSHAGTYSAACAVHIARGNALPAEYIGKAWTCDPTGNLVRYDELVPTGGSFHAKRVRDNVEALRSSDDWCRPVFLADGPDGAFYVCDMYRKTIEHPEYLPPEVAKHTDFESGRDMGRIWRIAKADSKKPYEVLGDANDEKLLAALHSANGWTPDTAFRLITERGAKSLAQSLEQIVVEGKSSGATTVACLNLLANAGALSDESLLAAMKHADGIARENAVRLSEPRLAESAQLSEHVTALAGDANVHVRYAVALALGETRGAAASRALDVLSKLATRDSEDKWFRAAILTSLPKPNGDWVLLKSLSKRASDTEGQLTLLQELARICAGQLGHSQSLKSFVTDAPKDAFDTRAALLIGFNEAEAIGLPAEVRSIGVESGTFAEAAGIAHDGKAPPTRRIRAINVLSIADDAESETALRSLVEPGQPTDIAVAAIRALAQPHHVKAFPKLLTADQWARFSPALRSTILASVTGRPEFAGVLIDAIESGAVPPAALSEPQRKSLLGSKDDAIKARATKLLAGGAPEDRKRAFEDAKAVLALKPDAIKGKRMFLNHCSSCHRLEKEGYDVGPDLYSIRSQPKESILLHIVIPEQEIAPNFTAYDCVTKDGRQITGIMTAESTSSVTLKQVLGLTETIPRDKIEKLTVSKTSLMPPGLEKAMSKQDLADLLSYLRGEQ